jgi:large subunit ribosomal protein L30e
MLRNFKGIKMEISDMKKIIEADKAVFGINETLKLIKKKQIEGVFIASNCPEEIEAKLNESKAKIQESEQTNLELGVLCKKSFNISVIGVKK